MYCLRFFASSVCIMIIYPPSPRLSSRRPAVVPSFKGETTSMMSPPSGTTHHVGNCKLLSRGRHTQEVLQPPPTDGRIFVDDFCAYDMRLIVYVSCTKVKTTRSSIQAAVLHSRGLSTLRRFGAIVLAQNPEWVLNACLWKVSWWCQ